MKADIVSIVFPVILILLVFGARAADFTTLYNQGLAAKQDGRYEEAAALLREALALEPANVEAAFHLGAVLSWNQQYEEALQVLEKALMIAPTNLDLRLAVARTKAWSNRWDAARSDLDAILANAPDHAEARVLLARIHSWQKHHAEAESEYRRVLGLPGIQGIVRTEVLTGLGDLMTWQDRVDEAREFYTEALAINPSSPELQEKLRLANEHRSWLLHAGYTYSTFARQSRSDWHESYIHLEYALDRATSVYLHHELSNRFDLSDEAIEGGAAHRFNDWLTAHASMGGSPDPDFRAKWTATAGGALQFVKGYDERGPSLLTFDFRHSAYWEGNAELFATGLEQHFTRRFWATGKWFHSINLTGQATDGWLARFDIKPWEPLQIYGGMADSKESLSATAFDLGRAVQTHTYFGGMVWEITSRWGVRLDYAQEHVGNLYTRRSVNMGIQIRF